MICQHMFRQITLNSSPSGDGEYQVLDHATNQNRGSRGNRESAADTIYRLSLICYFLLFLFRLVWMTARSARYSNHVCVSFFFPVLVLDRERIAMRISKQTSRKVDKHPSLLASSWSPCQKYGRMHSPRTLFGEICQAGDNC